MVSRKEAKINSFYAVKKTFENLLSRSHDTPQAHDKGWGCREALSYGTAPDGLDAGRAIFEIAVCTLEKGNALHATARSV
jgi:hypothetical protein